KGLSIIQCQCQCNPGQYCGCRLGGGRLPCLRRTIISPRISIIMKMETGGILVLDVRALPLMAGPSQVGTTAATRERMSLACHQGVKHASHYPLGDTAGTFIYLEGRGTCC